MHFTLLLAYSYVRRLINFPDFRYTVVRKQNILCVPLYGVRFDDVCTEHSKEKVIDQTAKGYFIMHFVGMFDISS